MKPLVNVTLLLSASVTSIMRCDVAVYALSFAAMLTVSAEPPTIVTSPSAVVNTKLPSEDVASVGAPVNVCFVALKFVISANPSIVNSAVDSPLNVSPAPVFVAVIAFSLYSTSVVAAILLAVNNSSPGLSGV